MQRWMGLQANLLKVASLSLMVWPVEATSTRKDVHCLSILCQTY
jgi:hypothetical protein